MNQITFAEDKTFKRISEIISNLIAKNSVYQERLDQNKMNNLIYNLFTKPDSGDDIDSISQEDLTRRIQKILVIEAMAGLLSDLTPEEMRIFDEAVEGR